MHEIKTQLEKIKEAVLSGRQSVDLSTKRITSKEYEKETLDPYFWDNPEKAQELTKKLSILNKMIETWDQMLEECESLLEMVNELAGIKDPELSSVEELKKMTEDLAEKWTKLEISTFLNGKYDEKNAILVLHAGTGGVDAQDFAEMLLRMYVRYAEKMEFEVKELEKSEGEEAGIKSCAIEIKGSFAYGYLKGENGVHRLVRQSPFNSKNTRETSFVFVEVLPEMDKTAEVAIDPEDLKIDTYKAGGKGGQNVNKTDSAVRITHIPTGLVAACQNERSQLQNKAQAMAMLTAKLIKLVEIEKVKEIQELKGKKVEMSWGNQIRSYVLHPYKMIKDHRTDYQENDPDKVLDGDLYGFIEAELKLITKEQ